MRIALFFCFLLMPCLAGAEEVSQEAAKSRPHVIAAVNNMALRAEPDSDSEIVARLPLMWPITVLQETVQKVTVYGRQDRWVRVAVPVCADATCESYRSGWTLDSFLGFDDRFERLNGLDPTTVADDNERNVLAYGVGDDGRFSRWSALCIPGLCNLEPGPRPECQAPEIRRAVFCVMTGTLYRYRDLVRGKGADGKWLPFGLSISSGKLCALGPDRGFDWKGGYATLCNYSDDGPAAMVEGMMDEKRKRLALVGADMVRLRDQPSADAEIMGGLPLGTAVTVYGPAGPFGSVGPWYGRWVRAWVTRCQRAVDGCEERTSGWLIDGVLAFEDRLRPMPEWRRGMIGGRSGNRTFRYETARDGTVAFSEDCGDQAECGKTAVSGRLYRYENLIIAKFGSIGRVDVLYIDEDGALCLPEVTDGSILYEFGDRRPSRCDR